MSDGSLNDGMDEFQPLEEEINRQEQNEGRIRRRVEAAMAPGTELRGQLSMLYDFGMGLATSREQTIARLTELADEIDTINRDGTKAKLVGTSTKIATAAAGLGLGIAATVVTGGALAPIIFAGYGVGGVSVVGGAVYFGAKIISKRRINKKSKAAMDAMEADLGQGTRYRSLFDVAENGLAVIDGVTFAVDNVAPVVANMVGAGEAAANTLEVISTVAGGIRIATGVLVLPLQIRTLVKDSKDIHYDKRHDKAERIREWVRELQLSQIELIRFAQGIRPRD